MHLPYLIHAAEYGLRTFPLTLHPRIARFCDTRHVTFPIRQRIELTVTAILLLAIPVCGYVIAHNAAWTAHETAVLVSLSASPQPIAAAASVAAILFGTPSTLAIIAVVIGSVALTTRSAKRTLRYALMMAIPLAYVIVVKHIVMSPRPSFIGALGTPPHSFSFPSGHTASATVLACILIYATRATAARWPARIVGVLLAVSVGLSRLLLGVHFPTDVATSLIICPLLVTAVGIILDHTLEPRVLDRANDGVALSTRRRAR